MFCPAQVRETLKYVSVGCCAVGMLVSSAHGQGKLTIECLPTSGSKTVTCLHTVTVECYISLDSGSQTIAGILLDFQCTLSRKKPKDDCTNVGDAACAGAEKCVDVNTQQQPCPTGTEFFGCVCGGGIGGGVPAVDVEHGGFPDTDHLFGPPYTGASDPGLGPTSRIRCKVGGASDIGPATLTPALSPAYLGEITYQVSDNASGEFTFDLEDREEPDVNGICRIDCLDQNPKDTRNVCNTTNNDCALSKGNCETDGTPCADAGDCSGGQACDLAGQVQETCCIDPTNATRILLALGTPLPFNFTPTNLVVDPGTCQLYGDVFPYDADDPDGQPVGNCMVDIDDLLVMLAAFSASPSHCPAYPDAVNLFPCDQVCTDGVVDIDDVVSALSAFGRVYACPHPCRPGACCFPGGICRDGEDDGPPGTWPPTF